MADRVLEEADWTVRAQAHRARVEGVHRTASPPRDAWRAPPGVGLPVHLLQPAGAPAAGLASRLRHRAGRRVGPPLPAGPATSPAPTGHGRRRSPGGAAGHRAVRGRAAARDRRAVPAARLLRPTRVGHGLPRRRRPPPGAAAAGAGRQRRGGGVDAVALQPFRRLPLLHRGGRARNQGRPTRATQPDTEQPGCLHANMDLYRWCYKLGPLVDSELLVACLELAAAARELDMRASPYDLRRFGFDPIRIEEPSGRAEYVRCQGEIAARAARCGWRCCPDASGCRPRRRVGGRVTCR